MADADGVVQRGDHPGEVEASVSDNVDGGPSINDGGDSGVLQLMQQFSEMEGVDGNGASSSASNGHAEGAAPAVACASPAAAL